jgi:hypothetical protein
LDTLQKNVPADRIILFAAYTKKLTPESSDSKWNLSFALYPSFSEVKHEVIYRINSNFFCSISQNSLLF